jgi:hypothetical protein
VFVATPPLPGVVTVKNVDVYVDVMTELPDVIVVVPVVVVFPCGGRVVEFVRGGGMMVVVFGK